MSHEISQERLLKTILAPHISEKTTICTEKKNEYVFVVAKTASKGEIKNAVEQLLDAKVKAVTTLNTKPKEKIFRGKKGSRKAWKKAYVTLEMDSKIELGAQ